MNENDFENQELSENDQGESQRLVPVGEAIRYRKRAQSAESQIEELSRELEKTNLQNNQLLEELNDFKQENMLVSKLVAAGTNDIETAVLIAKKRLESQENKDIDTVVSLLVEEKGHLFGADGSIAVAPKTLGVRHRVDSSRRGLENVARKASASGNRLDVHEYMRARRQYIK